MDGIKSKDFNAKQAFEGLLRTQNLKSLVQTNLDIQAAIKSLDQDVQSLVFENYNKFIGSIDVVRRMREDIERSEKDLDRLAGSIETIRGLSAKIDDTLRPKREEIQKLDRINQDLSKLKMLWELPEQFKEDKKQLDAQEFHKMGAEEVARSKPDFLRLLRGSLESLNLCKEKLFEFHSEPLIAPIFRDVAKNLALIQSLLVLHFYDNHGKMDLELLGDLFRKLFNVTALLDAMRALAPGLGDKSLNISIDSVCGNFFKYLSSAFSARLSALSKQAGGESEYVLIRGLKLELCADLEDFRARMGALAEGEAGLRPAAEALLAAALGTAPAERALESTGAGRETLAGYANLRLEFISRSLREFYAAFRAAPFFAKARAFAEARRALGPEEARGVTLAFARELVLPDGAGFARALSLLQAEALGARDLLDVRAAAFPALRGEAALSKELADSAASFARTLELFGQFLAETMAALDLEGCLGELGALPHLLQTLSLRAATAHGCSFALESPDRELRAAGPAGPQPPPLKTNRLLKLLHLCALFKSFGRLGQTVALEDPGEVLKLLFAELTATLESYFYKAFWAVGAGGLAPAEALPAIKNLTFLANFLSLSGKQKSRLAKARVSEAGAKVSDAAKLIARQAEAFEERRDLSGQAFYFSLAKLFFKAFRLFLKDARFAEVKLPPLAHLFALSAQVIFETVEKEEEKLVAHLFHQVLDDLALLGSPVEPEKLAEILAQNKDQIF